MAGFLVDARGQTLTDDRGRARRPQVIKVKYSTGGDRGREIYTEVAVHRFLWTLGFPADDMIGHRGRIGDPDQLHRSSGG